MKNLMCRWWGLSCPARETPNRGKVFLRFPVLPKESRGRIVGSAARHNACRETEPGPGFASTVALLPDRAGGTERRRKRPDRMNWEFLPVLVRYRCVQYSDERSWCYPAGIFP